jgi:hypothetical protein
MDASIETLQNLYKLHNFFKIFQNLKLQNTNYFDRLVGEHFALLNLKRHVLFTF